MSKSDSRYNLSRPIVVIYVFMAYLLFVAVSPVLGCLVVKVTGTFVRNVGTRFNLTVHQVAAVRLLEFFGVTMVVGIVQIILLRKTNLGRAYFGLVTKVAEKLGIVGPTNQK